MSISYFNLVGLQTLIMFSLAPNGKLIIILKGVLPQQLVLN
jgi:hypothetical protein